MHLSSRLLSSACAFAVAVALPATPARAEGSLSLEDAVGLAMKNNERALKAPLRVEAAEGALDRARVAFLPTVVGQGSGALKSIADNHNRIASGQGTVTLTQPLFNLPAFPLYAQAKYQLESERWGSIEDKRQLAYDSAHSFLQALANDHLLIAAQRRLDRAKANEQDTQARAQAGLASSNDVTKAQVETNAAQGQIALIQGNVDKSYLSLGFLIGVTVKGPLTAPERTTNAAQRSNFRMDEIIKFASARRPDVRSSHEHTESLREFAKEPLYRLAPTLGVSAVLHTMLEPIAPEVPNDESLLLTLTWTIYDAGARYADKKTRVAQADSQALDEHTLIRSIETDVNTAIAGLRAARESYRVSDEGVTVAKKNTDETSILYRQGLARAIELTDATASQYDAEVALEAAKLSMEQAYLDLRQALGLDPTGDELTGAVNPSGNTPAAGAPGAAPATAPAATAAPAAGGTK